MPTHPVATTLLPVSQIHPNPDQPRKFFDPQAIEDLRASIKERGLINPISVKQEGEGDYLIMAGERRFRACCDLGWTEIDCRVWPSVTPLEEVELLSLVENVQRTDLTPLEVARGFKVLHEAPYDQTQEQIAKQVGKSQQTVGHYITISQLQPQVQEITNRLVNLGLAHLLEICRLKTPEDQIAVAQEAAQKELSVRELKALVEKKVKDGAGAKKPKNAKRLLEALYDKNGVKFKESGSHVMVTAPYDRTGKVDDFLARLKEEITLWCNMHPYTPSTEEQAAKANEEQDQIAYEQQQEAYAKVLAERAAYIASHPDRNKGVIKSS